MLCMTIGLYTTKLCDTTTVYTPVKLYVEGNRVSLIQMLL